MLPVGAQYLFEHVERPAHLVPSLIPGGGRVIRECGGGVPVPLLPWPTRRAKGWPATPLGLRDTVGFPLHLKLFINP